MMTTRNLTRVFIDGSAGTTGLHIVERLRMRDDIQVVTLPDDVRKDIGARTEALNSADIAFLCLPDAAAVEAVGLIDSSNTHTVLIDASTAHRTHPDWTYGFPELAGQRARIAQSRRIANPGCHASGFVALVAPLIQACIMSSTERLSATSLTGYSGGGKSMIAEYEADDVSSLCRGGNVYALVQQHKHLPEMCAVTGLEEAPVFLPIVEPYYSGMQMMVPVRPELLGTTVSRIAECYAEYYRRTACEGVVCAMSADEMVQQCGATGRLSATLLSATDAMCIGVCGTDQRAMLVALYDNLGKGASGAAVQNMNIVMGCEETCGLTLPEWLGF